MIEPFFAEAAALLIMLSVVFCGAKGRVCCPVVGARPCQTYRWGWGCTVVSGMSVVHKR